MSDHLPAWEAWCVVSGQWRTVSLSTLGSAKLIWLGLDAAAAKAALDLEHLDVTPEVWRQVRIIESGAIEELNRG